MTEKEERWLESLLEVDCLLKKKSINYFLDTGTLLGAVRDGKFIPWDGDIDLGVVLGENAGSQLEDFFNDAVGCGYNVNQADSGISLLKDAGVEINISLYREVKTNYRTTFIKTECNSALIRFLRNVKNGSHLNSRGHNLKFHMKSLIIKNKRLLLRSS